MILYGFIFLSCRYLVQTRDGGGIPAKNYPFMAKTYGFFRTRKKKNLIRPDAGSASSAGFAGDGRRERMLRLFDRRLRLFSQTVPGHQRAQEHDGEQQGEIEE
jgi:hypothetical protein